MTTIMSHRKTCRAGVLAAVLLWCAHAVSRPGFAQGSVPQNVQGAHPEQASPMETDAARGALDRFLDAHPEIESDVLGDPHRISDPSYIHDHPELEAFLESHPLVKGDPRAFISARSWRFAERRGNDTEELLSWFIPFSVFVCMLLAVLWVVRTILENRRWNKSFKVHEDVHTKLIDKFASGQELTAYMESDAGRRLLEWAPPSIEGRMPFAAGRILWSLQAGLILGLAGVGLVSVRHYVPDAAQPLLVFGMLGLTIGLGFCLSAVLSYGISKHLGLLGSGAGTGALQVNR
jgi:hypothetical protein